MVILELSKDEVDKWEHLMHIYPLDLGEKGLEPNKVLNRWGVRFTNVGITAWLEVFTEKEKYIWARMVWYIDEKELCHSLNDDVIGGVWECPLDDRLSVFVNVV